MEAKAVRPQFASLARDGIELEIALLIVVGGAQNTARSVSGQATAKLIERLTQGNFDGLTAGDGSSQKAMAGGGIRLAGTWGCPWTS